MPLLPPGFALRANGVEFVVPAFDPSKNDKGGFRSISDKFLYKSFQRLSACICGVLLAVVIFLLVGKI